MSGLQPILLNPQRGNGGVRLANDLGLRRGAAGLVDETVGGSRGPPHRHQRHSGPGDLPQTWNGHVTDSPVGADDQFALLGEGSRI